MKLRSQMLTLSLATLLVPAFGWLLLQELEQFLRDGQQQALSDSARTVARSLPAPFETTLYGRDQVLPLRRFSTPPALDGYASEWPEAASAMVFDSGADTSGKAGGGVDDAELLGGRFGRQDFLFLRIGTAHGGAQRRPDNRAGAEPITVVLFLRSGRGLNQYRISAAAPGPLTVQSQTPDGGQLAGHWMETATGYALELALPPSSREVTLSLGVEAPWRDRAGVRRVQETGTLRNGRPARWLSLAPADDELGRWLRSVAPEAARAWIVDRGGWVVADTGPPGGGASRDPSWVERFIYRTVVGGELAVLRARPSQMLRLEEPVVQAALAGQAAQQWGGDPESAEVRNTVATPVLRRGAVDGQVAFTATGTAGANAGAVLAAVVLEANTDGALLFTNRTLGRLLAVSLLLSLALVAGLWFLATRLSRRVQALSGAVSEAMNDAGQPRELPMAGDRDELGELARNNARLLRAVADYTRYLQNLAGRLSHELKTPLAITRSSMDNLASEALSEDSRRYLDRAREGLDRQTAIVRAMSEASRLESAVSAADWETIDLAALVGACAEGYRSVYAGRKIQTELPDAPAHCRCAPDLLAQALDKLVDNAVSLTGEADTITLRLQVKGNWRHLSVRNSGTRLPETLQDQLFDSLVSVREPGSEGLHLGLGLHIVRLVAEAHGGSVEARNLPGEDGVAFTIHLPAA